MARAMMSVFASVALATALPCAASTIWYVDGNTADSYSPPSGSTVYATIQAAIDAAANGDVVEVFPGTYALPGSVPTTVPVVDFKGKQIRVRAAFPITSAAELQSVLSGSGLRRVVEASTGETLASSLEGFVVRDGRAASGGGMSLVGSSIQVIGCKIRDNQAVGANTTGGGVRLVGSVSEFHDCEFLSNYAPGDGGAVYAQGGQVKFLGGCKFESNWSGLRGGALSLNEDETKFVGVSFVLNRTDGFNGGCLYAVDSGARFEDCNFSQSTATNTYYGTIFGGAALLKGTQRTPLFLRCDFVSNRSDSYYADFGGAVAVGRDGAESGNATFVDCLFQGNRSQDGHGGAISFNGSGSMLVLNCRFISNSAGAQGGAIAIGVNGNGGSVQIRHCKFVTSSAGSGGAIFLWAPNANAIREISDCVIVGTVSGHGIFQSGSGNPLPVSASAFCGNTPSDFQGGSIDADEPNCFATVCSDQNGNFFPDSCDPVIEDCNQNGIDDTAELFENDLNNDGVPDDCQSALTFDGLSTEVRPILHYVNGELQGAVCWRVFATFRDRLAANPPRLAAESTVTAMYGNSQWPMSVAASAGFYQRQALVENDNGREIPTDVNTSALMPCTPDDDGLRYDSFFTISAECASLIGVDTTPDLSFSGFNAPTGSAFQTSNGAIFVYPNAQQSRAGEDRKVLLMQLTTKSATRPTGLINLRGRIDVDENPIWDAYALPIPAPVVTPAVDCNGNGVHDGIDIASGFSRDCNFDGTPDSCQGGGLANDCDGDGVPDACEIRLGTATDTNGNGVPDNCECPGDVDQNGSVNVDDLLEVFAQWGLTGSGLSADLDDSGSVGPEDLLVVLNGWGICL